MTDLTERQVRLLERAQTLFVTRSIHAEAPANMDAEAAIKAGKSLSELLGAKVYLEASGTWEILGQKARRV